MGDAPPPPPPPAAMPAAGVPSGQGPPAPRYQDPLIPATQPCIPRVCARRFDHVDYLIDFRFIHMA